jgi:hypothetical protein
MPENSGNLEPFADINLDEMSVKLIDYLRKELDSKSVDYLEPLTRLTEGTKGHVLLGHPEVVKMLLASIYEISGIKLKMPE